MKRLSANWRCLWLVAACFVFGQLAGASALAEEPAAGDSTSKATASGKPGVDAAKGAQDDEEYYELLRLFADTVDQIDRNYVKDISRRQLMEAAIRGMIEELDQYSNYIPPEEIDRFRTGVESEFGGIGIQVSIEDGWLTVISPIYGSPAYEAGVIAGDQIVEIEGENSKGITLDEAVKKLKGKVGTKVKVTVRHPGDEKTEEMALERQIVRVETVLGDLRNDDDSWDYLYDDDNKIAYIRVTAFSRHTTDELKAALDKLAKSGMQGLVLDLRFNPGGLLTSAIEICDLFVSEGKIVSTEGRNAPERVWNAHGKGTFAGFPIAVLVNRYSASASEIVSACLQDHQRGVVIGERTWGKGSVQNIIELEEGKSALKLTTAGYLRPSGKNIHKFEGASDDDDWGVRPNDGYLLRLEDKELTDLVRGRRDRDVIKKRGPDEKAPEVVDRQLVKALDYLREQIGEKKMAGDDGDKKPDVEDAEKKAARADGAKKTTAGG
ncbi:MAG: S41 family peptidase [Pirellulaceae bacterium]